MKKPLLFIGICFMAAMAALAKGEKTLVCAAASEKPVIDGKVDALWAKAEALTTYDPIARINITLKAVHTGKEIFILAQFPDKTKSMAQQDYVWDKDKKEYITGPSREDTLVLKWNMEPFPVDLHVKSDDPYVADIWYWKSHRTDPVGYADDKIQRYTDFERPSAAKIYTKSGRLFFLTRDGDAGTPAFKPLVYSQHIADTMTKYEIVVPTGSRADIRAKGFWKDGVWTVEFGRALDTGHADDIAFMTGQRYLFGISRFEIAGRDPDPSIDEPLFGAGDITEHLWLEIK